MSGQLPSDQKLATLKSDAERGYVSVTTADIIALVECAEALKRLRITIDYDSGCSCGQCMAMRAGVSTLAKLEAL